MVNNNCENFWNSISMKTKKKNIDNSSQDTEVLFISIIHQGIEV